MLERLRKLIPEPHAVREHRALRWLGPLVQQPRLWHASRRGVALGLAIGVFFGLLVPIAQIPFAALAAVFLRANIPAAVASTLITNPLTFAPVYYAAFHLGDWLLGGSGVVLQAGLGEAAQQDASGLALWAGRLAGIGAPLALGLATLAVSLSLLLYFGVHWAWRLKILRAWKKRRGQRGQARKDAPDGRAS